MKKLAIAFTALAALTGSALAADLPVRQPVYKAAPPPPPAMTWSGCYIGGGGGYGMWNQENTAGEFEDGRFFPFEGGMVTNGGRGWFGTVQGGCDYQFGGAGYGGAGFGGPWVIGVFGDYDFASMKGNVGNFTDVISAEEKLSSSWAVGGRIGYSFWDKLLAYVSGGYSQAHFNQIDFAASNLGGLALYIPSHTYSGWFIGSGYEYRLDWLFPQLTWKTEYRYYDYGSNLNHILFAEECVGCETGIGVDSHKFVQTVRSELVWRFWSY